MDEIQLLIRSLYEYIMRRVKRCRCTDIFNEIKFACIANIKMYSDLVLVLLDCNF